MNLSLTTEVFQSSQAISQYVENKHIKGKKVGFVPTMGALHAGHLSLVKKAQQENDYVVVSVFVNPTQFNNPDDLANYPRNIDSDLEQLKDTRTDALFFPSVEEIYPGFPAIKPEKSKVDLADLEKVMEGKFRPGHFMGVVTVVERLFEIVHPDKSYFGEKDFQQLAVIRRMVHQLNLPVIIESCPTVREQDGLAMSSRNLRLTKEQRTEACRISKALFYVRDNRNNFSIEEIKSKAISIIESHGMMKVEYLEIADEESLQSAIEWNQFSSLRCLTAVQIGNIRLIDNVKLTSGTA